MLHSVSCGTLIISVIIMADDKPDELGYTVLSVTKQVYPWLECVVVSSRELNAHSFGSEVHIICDTVATLRELFEQALAYAKGEYVFLIKSGDYVLHDSIFSELLIDFETFPDFIYGNMKRLFLSGKEDVLCLPTEITVNTILYDDLPLVPVALIKKSVLLRYNFYDEDLHFAADWAFLVKAFLSGSVTYEHKDITVAAIKVSRTGQTYKLSNGHLRAIEKSRILAQHPLPVPAPAETSKPGRLANYPTLARVARTARNLKKGLEMRAAAYGKAIEKMQEFYSNSLRTKYELPSYIKKHQAEVLGIPIIINNRNHLTYLLRLIASLEKRGYHNINIIDNNSTFPPLLEFYRTCPHKVYMLNDNVGFCALWDTTVFDDFKGQYYVYTDSDLELVEECPADFLVVLYYLLNRYNLGKIGLSLPINDLPAHFENRAEVIEWEREFQKEKVEKLAYLAPVDTTFALYKPDSFGYAGLLSSFRTSFPYSARHLPWYENTRELTPEQRYYYTNSKTSTHWSKKINLEE